MQRGKPLVVSAQIACAVAVHANTLIERLQVIVNGCIADVEAAAHQFASGLYSHRRLGAWQQKQAAIGLGRHFAFEQCFNPRLGTGVAGQHKADQLGMVAHAVQLRRTALALFFIDVVQYITTIQTQNAFNIRQNFVGWCCLCGRTKQQTLPLTAVVGQRRIVGKRHATGERKSLHQRLERFSRT